MGKRKVVSGPRRYVSTSEMSSDWRDAYVEVGGTNPYSMRIDALLRPKGYGVHDVKTRIALIRSKKNRDRTEDEAELLNLADELLFMSEQGLFDKCSETTNGAIFLLESKYGYRKGQDLNLQVNPEQVKKMILWGDEQQEEAPKLEEVSKAAEG